MSTGLKIGLASVVGLLVIGLILFVYSLSVKNNCIDFEGSIDAQYKQNQNNLSTYSKKILEMVQVPKMNVKHVTQVTEAAMKGRYGKDGVKAVLTAVAEDNQNATVDAQLYRNIQQAMEAGRDSWEANQKTLLDICGEYYKYHSKAPQSAFVGDYPNKGYSIKDEAPDSKCVPVITARTAESFETKREEALQIE